MEDISITFEEKLTISVFTPTVVYSLLVNKDDTFKGVELIKEADEIYKFRLNSDTYITFNSNKFKKRYT